MAKTKRKHNPNLVRWRRSYTFSEIAEIYGMHPRTVQSWRKQGLKVIDETSKPYLVIGAEIKRFVKEKNQKGKHRLKPGEFFCPRCRIPQKSSQNRISIEITHKRLGRYRQAIIRGICDVCRCRLFRFSSDRQVQELKEGGLILAEYKTALVGSEDNSSNTDIKRSENGES